ncbi:TetR/AcrR family transcriptional regulator [Actinophytocola sp.]|uniref:TetR/AcrR family transcriptional regulator n=1 Tax=Actinophytocola sp. TaxID=1872138 RepID=UPI002ED53343
MRRTAAETREHILEVATRLFYWHGIRATGVDKIAAEAGVSTNVLYRAFATKDDLIAAYVDGLVTASQQRFDAATEAAGPDPRDKILAMFDALAEDIRPEVFRGCACMMTMAEFPDEALPAHRGAVGAKEWIRARFGELAEQLGVADPKTLADQLSIIWEGTNTTAQALGADGPPTSTRPLVAAVLDHHVRLTS